jgi:homoserine dehydrogenase
VVNDPEVDIVVELIGGYTVAKDLVMQAIANGKHVVTANKALLAVHGNEIFAAAQAKGVMVAFEAAVAGGIPIIKALREGLSANRIQWIAGIINGTTNFILSEMRDKGLSFDDGAERSAAPGLRRGRPDLRHRRRRRRAQGDADGAIAFGIPIQFDKAHIEGISKLDAVDIRYAEQLGYRIKLLGITKRQDKGVELRVHPTLIPAKRLIANVEGAMNAVLVWGDAVGATLYYGKGAGAEPTASAVIADLVDVTRLLPPTRCTACRTSPSSRGSCPTCRSCPWPRSRPPTTCACAPRTSRAYSPTSRASWPRWNISIDAMLQREPEEGEDRTDIVMLTHVAKERDVNAAIAKIEALSSISGKVTRIRMEELKG